MKKQRWIQTGIAIMGLCGCMTGCNSTSNSYDTYVIPEQEESTLEPVASLYVDGSYEGIEPTIEETIATYASQDGLCVIEKKEHYYEVTLNYENGSYKEIGAAYAETIQKASPDYVTIMEPYLYENIKATFSDLQGDYTALEERINALKQSLPEAYQEEMEGFAEEISNGEHGFAEDEKLSYEEAILMQMVPDALRGTACSAMAVWGEKSATGKPIAARILEWDLGSENQMCSGHCVVHMINGDKSFTSVSVLGLLNVLTAVNDNGVFVGELDVGINREFIYEGKTCYTYDLRYALEKFDNAKDMGEYLINNSVNYTFSHSLILTDAENSYCVENCVSEDLGVSLLRDTSTELHESLEWSSPDSLCVVNSFAAAVNEDRITGSEDNLIRWMKYNQWIGAKEQLTVTDVKDMLTCEQVDSNVVNVHSEAVYHMVIVDYDTGMIQVAFTGREGAVDKPEFVNIGTYDDFERE